MTQITFDQFKALDIKIAKVLEVEDHSNADKLYVVTLQVGEEKKTVVAGIREHYSKEELKGKEVVLVNNLAPATIRGVQSEGMILAAKDDTKLVILIPEKEVKVGSSVS